MTDVRALQDRLERTFRGAFHVRDVAEALLSFDAQMPSTAALERLERRGFGVVGVREGGLVTGYATATDLGDVRVCGDAFRPFEDAERGPSRSWPSSETDWPMPRTSSPGTGT